MDTENILMVADGRSYGEMGEEVRGLRSTNRQLQNTHRDVKYRKWSSQRTYMHDPWTQMMMWVLPEWWGGEGRKGGKSGQL